MEKTLCLHIDDDPNDPNVYRASLRTWPEQSEVASVAFDKEQIPQEGADSFTIDAIRKHFATVTAEDEQFTNIGHHLFGLIAQGGLAEHFQAGGAEEQIILDVRAKELRNLPWELMMHQNLPLFLQAQRRFCRGHLRQDVALPDFAWPLRILVVIGSAPNDPAVRAEDELSDIIHALIPIEAQVDLKVLRTHEPVEILKHFSGKPDAFNPHIFHFIGHGGVEEGESCLNLFNEGENQDKVWTATDIKGAFVSVWKPRLVFVNACRSSSEQSQELAQTGLWSVTNAFLEAGTAAVLGIHTDIEGELAARFSASFYRALAQGLSLDLAVAEGRQELWTRLPNARKRRDWAAPCLEVRALPQQILHLDRTKEEKRWQQVRRERLLRELPRLVDRHEDRWQAWRNLTANQHNVYMISGDAGVGKTRFAYQLLARCALCGFQTRYVNLPQNEPVDALTVLRRICDGESNPTPAQFLTGPLEITAFQPFRDKVDKLAELLSQGTSEHLRLKDVDRRDVQQIVAAFCQGLESVAAEQRLVIAIDHWKSMDVSQLQNFLLPYLFEWCLARQNQDITLLLVMRPDEVAAFETDYPTLSLTGFPKAKWTELAREFLQRIFKLPPKPGDDEDDIVELLLKLYGNTLGSVWSPAKLGQLEAYGKNEAQWPAAEVGI